jgi:DNA-binding PadR family transcriptional regulator
VCFIGSLLSLDVRPCRLGAPHQRIARRSKSRIATYTRGALDLPGGTVYPALRRLELAGLVEGVWSEVGGRRRRTYHLTDRGRAALAEERSAWRGFARVVGSVLGQPAS